MKAISTSSKVFSDYGNKHYEDKFLFTKSELLGLLLFLRELRDFEISMNEIFDGGLQLFIGNSVYQIYQMDDEAGECY